MSTSTWFNNSSNRNITVDFTVNNENCWPIHFDELPKTLGVMATVIGTSVLHIPSSMFAVFSNAIVMYTILKKPMLKTPANLLIFSMCFSDFLVGLTVQPLTLASLWLRMSSIHPCTLQRCIEFLAYLCCSVSLLNAALVTMDRYFAICKPYRYIPEIIKGKYALGVTAVWFLWTLYTLLYSQQVISQRAFELSLIVFLCFIFTLIISCYRKIYVILRQHQIQIASQRVQVREAWTVSHDQQHNTSPSAAEKKRLSAIGIIVLTLLLCYMPYLLFSLVKNALKLDMEVDFIVGQWVQMLVFLNSSFNPIIYCVRVPTIAEEVKKVLKRLKARILCEQDEL